MIINQYFKRIVLALLMIVLVSIGNALTLKASIGVAPWNAMNQEISAITGLKIGTVGMYANILCVIIQLFILKKNFKFKHLLQVFLSLMLGYTLNFFYYNVLSGFIINDYIIRVIVLILGYTIIAFTVAIIMLIDVVTYPIESACNAISNKTGIKFSLLRQGVDVISIAVAIILWLVFNTPLQVREGTVIGMVIFAPIIDFFIKRMSPILIKYGVISEASIK